MPAFSSDSCSRVIFGDSGNAPAWVVFSQQGEEVFAAIAGRGPVSELAGLLSANAATVCAVRVLGCVGEARRVKVVVCVVHPPGLSRKAKTECLPLASAVKNYLHGHVCDVELSPEELTEEVVLEKLKRACATGAFGVDSFLFGAEEGMVDYYRPGEAFVYPRGGAGGDARHHAPAPAAPAPAASPAAPAAAAPAAASPAVSSPAAAAPAAASPAAAPASSPDAAPHEGGEGAAAPAPDAPAADAPAPAGAGAGGPAGDGPAADAPAADAPAGAPASSPPASMPAPAPAAPTAPAAPHKHHHHKIAHDATVSSSYAGPTIGAGTRAVTAASAAYKAPVSFSKPMPRDSPPARAAGVSSPVCVAPGGGSPATPATQTGSEPRV